MLKLLLQKVKQLKPAPMRITLSVVEQIRKTIGSLAPEHGGVLGGRPEFGVITEFYFDCSARRSKVTYSPDDELLNRLFADDWNPRDIRVMGFVHSHPGLRRPSSGDLQYSGRILEQLSDLDRLLIPIVISAFDGERFEILPYAVVRDGENFATVSPAMSVLDEQGHVIRDWEHRLDQVATTEPHPMPVPSIVGTVETSSADRVAPTTAEVRDTGRPIIKDGPTVPETFRRVVNAYDLDLLKKSRVIYVGTGGAASFIEDLARAGVGQHVLIDPDSVSETNLGTQQTYRRDLDRPKVDAIAERIKDINPGAFVFALRRLLDEIDDREFEFLATGTMDDWPLSQTLVCGLTDSFHAQARVNRLALHFGLPSLCAQVYEEGRGAEVTFTHPDVTPACHRCVLSSRYRAYLENDYENTVTSDGAPIFSTARINALIGFVAMAQLHQGTAHPRWGSLLEKMGNRNLLQVRMDPDLGSTAGLSVFDRVFEQADRERILFDETVWLPQRPEGSGSDTRACPDCGGTGHLVDSLGTFTDTRTMRE